METKELINTKTAWLGEVPSHWEIKRLGGLFEERNEIVSENDYAPLSVTMKGIVPQLESAAKTMHVDNRKKVCVGDFAINSRSDRRGSGGLSYYEGSVSIVNTVLKPSKFYVPEFTHYLLTNKLFQDEYYAKGKGIVADMWSTRFSEMKTIYLPVPPKNEQDEIVQYIKAQEEKINLFIQKKQRFIELLKEQRQSKIDEAISKGINPNVKFKNTKYDWLGSIPEHWEIRRLGTIGSFSKGGNISRAELVENGIPAILYGDIYTKYDIEAKSIINRIEEETAANSIKIEKGYLLFTGSGETKEDIGKCIIFNGDDDVYVGGDVIIFKQNEFDSHFISYSQNSSFAKYQKAVSSKGDIIVHTYSSKLRDVVMPYPPTIEEQKQIVSHIKTETATIDTAIAKAEREIELIREYKEAMIAEAVMGKRK